ncbi:MAG: hypothetical protein ACOCQD_00100 [archaeon]
MVTSNKSKDNNSNNKNKSGGSNDVTCTDGLCEEGKEFIKNTMEQFNNPLSINPLNINSIDDIVASDRENKEKLYNAWQLSAGLLTRQNRNAVDVASTWITNYENELQQRNKQIDDLQKRLARQKKENNRLSVLTRNKGVNMEDKDMEILTNKIDKILDEKVGKLEENYKKELNNLSEKVNNVLGEIKTDVNSIQNNQLSALNKEIQEIKNYTDQSCKNGQCSIDEMKTLQQRAEELKNKYDELSQNINGINNNLSNTYNGINELREELGLDADVQCPYEDCGEYFNSENNKTGSGLVVCPSCGRSAQLSDDE